MHDKVGEGRKEGMMICRRERPKGGLTEKGLVDCKARGRGGVLSRGGGGGWIFFDHVSFFGGGGDTIQIWSIAAWESDSFPPFRGGRDI